MEEKFKSYEFNVTRNWRQYQAFIKRLRFELGVRYTHRRPVLNIQEEPPTQFFNLVLRTDSNFVRFRLRMDNLYLIGYQMENGQWLEFGNSVSLIQEHGTTALGFRGNYDDLEAAAGRRMEEINVGFHSLVYSINRLATSTDGKIRAHCLIVVIMMFCESTRLNPICNHMVDSGDGRQIEDWMKKLVHLWSRFSLVLLRADADPYISFQLESTMQIQIRNVVVITNIADVAEILGIVLGRCLTSPSGQRRFPRMTSDEGQCFLGIPLVEVFSVRIDNIDGEDPGQLYGTITVNDGLNVEYIYNRTSSNPESIKPGQNASLTGPFQSILAIGNFTIKLLLTDKDTWSWDDEIINKDISWYAFEIGNVYDKPIFQKLDGNNGSVTVNYAVLRNAVAARITVTLEEGGESTANVYGKVDAHYDGWKDPNTICLLFNRSSDDYVDVRRWQYIPLLRSVVAVPLNGSLIVTASLYDYDTLSGADEIAKGAVEFPAEMSGTSSKQIQGEDGNWVTVTVYWTCEI